MEWDNDVDDLRLGRCPRCEHVDPVKISRGEEVELFKEDLDDEPFVVLKKCRVCGLGGADRSPIKGGYLKRDLLEVVDELPTMGKPCYHCGSRIPRFLDLKGEERGRIHNLIRSGDEAAAAAALREATGCPAEWARIWVTHPWGPRRPARVWVGPPCSRCGRPLRTRLARQCFECGLDWHDPGSVPKLE